MAHEDGRERRRKGILRVVGDPSVHRSERPLVQLIQGDFTLRCWQLHVVQQCGNIAETPCGAALQASISETMNAILRKYSAGILTTVVYAVVVTFAICCTLGLI